MKKRILAIALALAMLLPVFAVGSLAATPEEQAQALLDQTSAIFESGKYTLKARGPALGSSKPMSIVFIMDGDRSMFEANMDWVAMLQAVGTNKITDTLLGWFMRLYFGNKARYIVEHDENLVVFPSRRLYVEVPEATGPFDFADLFNVPERTATTVSEPVIGGKKYLCAALENEEFTTSYYYLNGTLKRIGMEAPDPETGQTETFAFEIDLFSPTVDESYFSTSGMRKASIGLPSIF